MLLFGGQLSTKKSSYKDENDLDEERDKNKCDDITPTPNSELIERLEDNEHRLLEELKRTRVRIQQEWRLNVNDLDDANTTVVEMHTIPNQTHDRKINDKLSKKIHGVLRKETKQYTTSKQEESMIKTIKADYDVLPILTNRGEIPFEVGLKSSMHTLPIFRLPNVHLAVKRQRQGGILNPNAVNTVDVEDDEAKKRFGLTDDELRSMGITNSGSSFSPQPHISFANATPVSLKYKSKQKRRRGRAKLSKATRGKTETVNTALLRRQLQESIENVQSYSQLVKADISAVRKMCPITNIRAEVCQSIDRAYFNLEIALYSEVWFVQNRRGIFENAAFITNFGIATVGKV